MKTRTWMALGVVAAASAGIGWWASHRHPALPPPAQAAAEPPVLYWYDPMRPDVHFDKPGKSPFMDMLLMPKYAEAPAGSGGVVQVDPRMVQSLGIRTARVARGTIAHSLDAVGAVDVDEHLIYAIESRTEGWVERLAVRAVGDPVKQGQSVAGVYSPDLFSAQQELALAVKSGDAELIAASRQRLLLLGLSEAQVAQVQATGQAQRQAQIVSPRGGVVTELNVREGQKVMPGTPLMRIADLSHVWIAVEIPEPLAGGIAEGRRAEARLTALPGRVFEGRVDYVYPNLDAATRTLRARIAFANRDGALKPGMFATVTVLGRTQGDVLKVPSDAVIRTGRRTVVIVQEAEGRFRPAEVTLGPEHDGEIVILTGLTEGEDVVTSGQFLIDSEANLQGAYQRLEGGTPPTPSEHGTPPPPAEQAP